MEASLANNHHAVGLLQHTHTPSSENYCSAYLIIAAFNVVYIVWNTF